MVKLCNQPYENNSKYTNYFELFPYELSDFQKYAIEAIVEEQHVLITAHTGSGKTLPAEFALNYFHEKGKKVIYTSPIKALSNQKLYEFTNKYPHIQFGLMTGDIKTNPNADVLIMTTEILMNYLFNMSSNETSSADLLNFQININTELACVVFDEVHYINDEDRGHVWEQTILMLPPHIQMVMLSATIDAPERFAYWCETCKTPEQGCIPKTVYLASTNHRVVPLTHYGYVASTEALFKTTKNKELEQKLRNSANKIIKLQTDKGQYLEEGYKEIQGLLEIMENKDLKMKRKFVLNNLATTMKNNEMLPAIMFVFSRKQVETCAKEITTALLEDDSKVPYIVKRECDQIIRKLPNYTEYLNLPEYIELMALLENGIGIHHSGMIPILREIVELMISKGYIKMLFATESFAIGLDCPIRTSVFMNLSKFDGSGERYLMPHEYTQMAGRAGRRGIDTIGYVVHCNNLFPLPSQFEYKNLLCGKPQTLTSKFNISYSMILNLLKRGIDAHFEDFASKSMIDHEIKKQTSKQQNILMGLHEQIEKKQQYVQNMRTPMDICAKYLDGITNLPKLVNKKRKEKEKEIKSIEDNYKYIREDASSYKSFIQIQEQYTKEKNTLISSENYIKDQTKQILDVLTEKEFVKKQEDTYVLTHLGKIASNMAEIHPLIMSELLVEWDYMAEFTTYQIIGLLSCFCDIKVQEEKRLMEPKPKDEFLKYRIMEVIKKRDDYQDIEIERQIFSGSKYQQLLNYDLVDYMVIWAEKCDDENACKMFLQNTITGEKGISIGDFTRACLKISALSKELILIGELFGKTEWTHKLAQIDKCVLKYISTTQSLYV